MHFHFGPFDADRTRYVVTRGGETLPLTPKLLDLLFHFLEHPAELVTKEALLDAVWPGANVTDNALAQAISELRDALGDAAAAPQFIRTVARRGYRFVAPVERVATTPATSASPAAARTTPPPSGHPADLPVVVVQDFVNVTGDPDVAWLGAGIAETVTSDFAGLGTFTVVDRWRARQAAAQSGGAVEDLPRSVGATLAITGSYQRSGPLLRITARLVDVASGRALGDVKVDGRVQDVFTLQDTIATTFARHLGLALPPRARRPDGRETSSLEAYRACMEGMLKVESLDTTIIPAAIRDFAEAIRLDPRYAIAFTGLANAEVVAYEMTRARPVPDTAVLASGVAHARHAVSLDDGLAEGHATLSFLLTCMNQFDEAREAAHRAVVLEPDGWRHWYRLGHASWGEARLRALERALAIYPRFPYAHFERVMVVVARGDIDGAAALLRRGVEADDGAARSGERFPGVGFHWLSGALMMTRGDLASARAAFDRELRLIDRRRLYGPEYAAVAQTARGHADMAAGDDDAAAAAFSAALKEVADYPRALLGRLAIARRQRRGVSPAAATFDACLSRLEQQRRRPAARYLVACRAAVDGELDLAVRQLHDLLEAAPPSFIGWTIPIEPFLRPLHGHPGFADVSSRLAARAG